LLRALLVLYYAKFTHLRTIGRMKKFNEVRYYEANKVDSEIAMLTSSRDFWKKKAESYMKEG